MSWYGISAALPRPATRVRRDAAPLSTREPARRLRYRIIGLAASVVFSLGAWGALIAAAIAVVR